MLSISALSISAQVETAGGVKKRAEKESKESGTPGVTDRMQEFFQTKEIHDADVAYKKHVYRKLDLEKGANAALYYPEDVIDGQENLFRIILRLVVDGQIPAYEFLDGREIFTDQYKMNVADILNRFDIYAQPAKGSTEKNPKFVIDESDVPTSQVNNYYIIEKWEFDRRSNSMKTVVDAICPVLDKYGDYGNEAKYPMFWVKFDSLRPYLAQQYVFISDDNNLPQYSLDDFFNLGLYDGEIYKTRNMRNLSMAQMFPDEDDLKRAQDSIDSHLKNYGKDLWVPTREEYLAMKGNDARQKKGNAKEVDELPERNLNDDSSQTIVTEELQESKGVSSRSNKKTQAKAKKVKKVKTSGGSSSSANPSAEKSVRRRKR